MRGEKAKGQWKEKRERGGGVLFYIYADGEVVSGKGESNGFWEYGGHCLGNKCIGQAVTYVIS